MTAISIGGQGLKQLRAWTDRHEPGRPVSIGYFGSFPPQQYGFSNSAEEFSHVMLGDRPGLYAVSAQILARASEAPAGGAWLKYAKPIAIVGHTFYIYDVR